jgi:hypothetical protein
MLYEGKLIQALQTISPSFLYVLSDRNGVENEAPYVLVSILNTQKIGRETKSTTSLNNKQVVQQDVRVIYRITLHALATDVAQDTFETMWHGLSSDAFVYEFYQQGLGILYVSDITYTSAPVDTINYKRASIDITCLTNRINEYTTPEINTVKTHGDLEDTSGVNTDIDVTVNYP